MLKERNKQYGTIKFVDISSADYSSEENQGLDYKTVSDWTVMLLGPSLLCLDCIIKVKKERKLLHCYLDARIEKLINNAQKLVDL